MVRMFSWEVGCGLEGPMSEEPSTFQAMRIKEKEKLETSSSLTNGSHCQEQVWGHDFPPAFMSDTPGIGVRVTFHPDGLRTRMKTDVQCCFALEPVALKLHKLTSINLSHKTYKSAQTSPFHLNKSTLTPLSIARCSRALPYLWQCQKLCQVYICFLSLSAGAGLYFILVCTFQWQKNPPKIKNCKALEN